MKNLLLAILISIFAFFISLWGFNFEHSITIAIVTLLVTLWTNEALPLGVVSLLPILLFPTFDILSFKDATSNYAKPIIFLFLGGFLLAIAVEKINLHKVIANRLLSIFPPTPRGVIYSLAITSAFMSAFLSNTTTALMLTPIAIFLTDSLKLRVKFLLSVAYGASIGGILTPIGTPPNLIYFGFMSDVAGCNSITFINWMLLTAPLIAIMLLIVPYILSIGVSSLKLDKDAKVSKLNPEQKRLSFILLSLALMLILNSPIEPYYSGLGLNECGILLSYGILMLIPKIGFIKWEDSKKIPLEVIFLFGAGFTIAMAFLESNLAVKLTHYLDYFGDFTLLAILLLVSIFVSFTTQVTSNTALTSIALPIFFEFAKSSDLNPQIILLTATISASYAFMLPIATPPNAIVMSSGVIKIKEMIKIGFFINIIGALALTTVAYLYWAKVL